MKFWIIIRGYKCEKYLARCLKSVRSQVFNNYHIILILDNPPDQSHELALEYKHAKKNPLPMTIVENKKRMGLGYNIYNGIQLCKDADPEDVICFLDADDWLSSVALKWVSRIYTHFQDCLLTHGSYMKVSKCRRTAVSRRKPAYPIRNTKWALSHFKTVKVKLARLLPEKALKRGDEWAPAASDRGLMYALAEMAGLDRCKGIQDVLYYWRDNTPYKTNIALQKEWDKHFRSMKPFKRVTSV